jgi:hypothetical protein
VKTSESLQYNPNSNYGEHCGQEVSSQLITHCSIIESGSILTTQAIRLPQTELA